MHDNIRGRTVSVDIRIMFGSITECMNSKPKTSAYDEYLSEENEAENLHTVFHCVTEFPARR